MISIDEINKLQAQNKGLIEQNKQLQQDISTLQGKLDAYQMSENEANEIIAELKAYKDVNEDFKTAWEELKAENASLKSCLEIQRTDETKQYIEKVNVERKNYKLKSTLQEIKTIAENIIIAYTNIAKSNEKLKAFDLRNRLQQILQKITKAEEE